MSIKIAGLNLGVGYAPLIIAEMSGNHNQSLERALAIVEEAAKAGVHILKLQTYTPDTITVNAKSSGFIIDDKNSLWNGKSLYELYTQAYTPWDWHEPIMNLASELGLVCFSTPFDETAVDFLENLNVPAYKISSFENNHLPLVKKAASTGKPIIISTGMATIAEISEAVAVAQNYGSGEIILLKCTSTYPAASVNSNILTIPDIRDRFNCEAGLSDHTKGVGVAIAAVAHGATLIEKHFTLSRKDGGIDAAFSLEPDEMRLLVSESKRAWEAMGGIHYGGTAAEEKSKIYRRSLFVVEDMKAGDTFTSNNLRVVRPGMGLSPKYYNVFIGKTASMDIAKNTPAQIDFLACEG